MTRTNPTYSPRHEQESDYHYRMAKLYKRHLEWADKMIAGCPNNALPISHYQEVRRYAVERVRHHTAGQLISK